VPLRKFYPARLPAKRHCAALRAARGVKGERGEKNDLPRGRLEVRPNGGHPSANGRHDALPGWAQLPLHEV
jgi:hypothetical protein